MHYFECQMLSNSSLFGCIDECIYVCMMSMDGHAIIRTATDRWCTRTNLTHVRFNQLRLRTTADRKIKLCYASSDTSPELSSYISALVHVQTRLQYISHYTKPALSIHNTYTVYVHITWVNNKNITVHVYYCLCSFFFTFVFTLEFFLYTLYMKYKVSFAKIQHIIHNYLNAKPDLYLQFNILEQVIIY